MILELEAMVLASDCPLLVKDPTERSDATSSSLHAKVRAEADRFITGDLSHLLETAKLADGVIQREILHHQLPRDNWLSRAGEGRSEVLDHTFALLLIWSGQPEHLRPGGEETLLLHRKSHGKTFAMQRGLPQRGVLRSARRIRKLIQ